MRAVMIKIIFLLTVFLSAHFASEQNAFAERTYGDGDPFPLSCVNFSGSWTADDHSIYEISQYACSRLRVTLQTGRLDTETTIIPDNKARPIHGGEWRGNVRHRWNSKKSATIIETYRYMQFADFAVHEVIFLEQVNSRMVLESIYRNITPKHGEVKREYAQKIYRKAQ